MAREGETRLPPLGVGAAVEGVASTSDLSLATGAAASSTGSLPGERASGRAVSAIASGAFGIDFPGALEILSLAFLETGSSAFLALRGADGVEVIGR
jgi:hypothetical protein